VNKYQYQKFVTKLVYLTYTRLDIYNYSLFNDKYMKGLLFKRNEKVRMKMYTDANYAGFVIDRKSISNILRYWVEILWLKEETKRC